MKIHSSCEIEDFVETHLCKLCVILRSRVLRVVCIYDMMRGIIDSRPSSLLLLPQFDASRRGKRKSELKPSRDNTEEGTYRGGDGGEEPVRVALDLSYIRLGRDEAQEERKRKVPRYNKWDEQQKICRYLLDNRVYKYLVVQDT